MKIWGGDTSKKVEDFVSGESIKLDQNLIEYDVLCNKAHAKMLHKLDLLSDSELDIALQKLDEVLDLHKQGKFTLKQELEDVHSNIEEFLGDIGKKLHAGKSRNDQIALDMALYSKENLIKTIGLVDTLCQALQSKAEQSQFEMPGFTHTQKAMPTKFSVYLLSYKEKLEHDTILLQGALTLVDKNPLGAAAGFGSSIDVDKQFTTKELGMQSYFQNTIAAVDSRFKNALTVTSALSSVMFTLAQMSQDLLLFYLLEFVDLPSDYCTGSSIMPNKKNCDVLELVRAKAFKVHSGQCQLFEPLPSGYHSDFQESKGTVMNCFADTQSCLSMMLGIVNGLKPNSDKMKSACTPDIYAAQKALLLAKQGTPFRDAYISVKNSLKAKP